MDGHDAETLAAWNAYWAGYSGDGPRDVPGPHAGEPLHGPRDAAGAWHQAEQASSGAGTEAETGQNLADFDNWDEPPVPADGYAADFLARLRDRDG